MTLDRKLRAVRLVVTDVDGVLTDSITYYSKDGEALKGFNHRDGMAVKVLREAGFEVILMTGENSPIVAARAAKLKIARVRLGVADKAAELRTLGVPLAAIAFLGDDLNDLGALEIAGLSVVPADACPEAKARADWVTKSKGGRGVLREFADRLMRVRRRR